MVINSLIVTLQLFKIVRIGYIVLRIAMTIMDSSYIYVAVHYAMQKQASVTVSCYKFTGINIHKSIQLTQIIDA